nr:retron system putative HNH endonuclease [uncultured Pseudogulbenkiania sp.]
MRKVDRPACPDFMMEYLVNEPAREYGTVASVSKFRNFYLDNWNGLLRKRGMELRQQLKSAFSGKCCYCESSFGPTADGEIEQFRPKSLYPHLAVDWRNLYFVCPVCNRSKGARFPLKSANTVPGAAYEATVAQEAPLLLDPCLHNPTEHLVFLEDGHVAGLTEEGQTTVQVLALNRSELVLARSQQIAIAKKASPAEKERMTWQDAPYSEAVRQCLETESKQSVGDDYREALSAQMRYDDRLLGVDTEKGEGLENYRSVARYIKRLRIENFGPIRLLELDLSAPHSSQGPCFALLGENGVGKSTVLRALAMALSGKHYTQRLRLTSKDFLPEKAYEGEVRVGISGQPDVVMTLRRNKAIRFSSTGSTSLILAYGATRLLPRGRHKPKVGLRHAKIDNLFDPFLPMTDPAAWLATLDANRLNDVNEVLGSLLPEDHQIQLVYDQAGSGVRIVVGGNPARKVSELSDGYQSMVGMAVDIMQVMYGVYESMKDAQGVVLIDELGNHFHPAWRLRCVAALRRAFPYIQFIYSTHDPLCLRGLEESEVAVLRRDKLGGIYALDELPPVDKMRVEQLLTSEHFGLRSTLDPKMEDDVRAYEELLAKGTRTKQEDIMLNELIKKLTDTRYLGVTRRERLALKLVDYEGEPDVPATSSISAKSLSESTVLKLRSLMNEVSPIQDDRRD